MRLVHGLDRLALKLCGVDAGERVADRGQRRAGGLALKRSGASSAADDCSSLEPGARSSSFSLAVIIAP